MAEDRYYHHSFTLWLKSISQPLTYSVAGPAWGRLKRALEQNRKGFFIFATTDGRTFALNLNFVHLVRFRQEASDVEVQVAETRSAEINLYYYEREIETFVVDDPVDLAELFTRLKTGVDHDTVSFAEKGGDLVMLNTNELIVLESSTVFVEEGFMKVYQQKQRKKQ